MKKALVLILTVAIAMVSGCNNPSQEKEADETTRSSKTTTTTTKHVSDEDSRDDYDDYDEDVGYDAEDDDYSPNIPPITKLPTVEEFVNTSIDLGYYFNSEPPYSGTELWPGASGVITVVNKAGYPNSYSLSIYDSGAKAKEWFQRCMNAVGNDDYDEVVTGDLYYNDNGDNGYILFDVTKEKGYTGEFFDGSSSYDKYYYGGIFYCGNIYMEVYTGRSESQIKNSEKDKIDEILRAYGLPTPRS